MYTYIDKIENDNMFVIDFISTKFLDREKIKNILNKIIASYFINYYDIRIEI